MTELKMAKGRQVRILDAELVRRRDENRKYLLELQNENLLLPYWGTGFPRLLCFMRQPGTEW